jgi:hypothetical protein
MKKQILILLGCLVALSCGSAPDQKIGLSIAGARTNLINAKTTSCYAQILSPTTSNDVEARYIRLVSPQISWTSPDTDAHVTGIHFKFTGGPMGNFSKDIDGDELRGLFNNLVASADNVINAVGFKPDGTPNSAKTIQLACPLIVGGITLTDAQDVAFELSGQGSIEGFERNPITQEETEFSNNFYFSVTNRGAQN